MCVEPHRRQRLARHPGELDNRISSFKAFANCGAKLFENNYYGGSAYPGSGFYIQSSNVGVAMNDRASSVQFS